MVHMLLLDVTQSPLWMKSESSCLPPWDLHDANLAPWPSGTVCTIHADYTVTLFNLISYAKKNGGLKVIPFKKKNWWWSQVACMQFFLATSPVFLNPGSIKQWETTLCLGVKFLGQLLHKSSFSSWWLCWIRPFFNFLSAFELPATASAQPFLRGAKAHEHTQTHIHTSNCIALKVRPKLFCPAFLHFWAGFQGEA